MATIYRIDHGTARRAPATSGHRPTSAEIILFPGVRYERWSAAQEEACAPRRGRPVRDRLELAD